MPHGVRRAAISKAGEAKLRTLGPARARLASAALIAVCQNDDSDLKKVVSGRNFEGSRGDLGIAARSIREVWTVGEGAEDAAHERPFGEGRREALERFGGSAVESVGFASKSSRLNPARSPLTPWLLPRDHPFPAGGPSYPILLNCAFCSSLSDA
jgi:hypothetical protein